MSKLLVTRWRRKNKPVYLSNPVKDVEPLKEDVRATDVEPPANVDNVVAQVSENVLVTVSADVVSVKQKVGRPRKIGKALDVDCMKTVKKNKSCKEAG